MKKPVAWITGASSGIGEALAYTLNLKGYRLILSARNEAALNRVAAQCSSPEEVQILPLDLAKTSLAAHYVEQALGFFGQIDLLVNNGGISQRSLVEETELEVDRRIMEVNYFGTIALTKALLPHFMERRSGHIATVSSLVGKFGTPYRSAYAASKHALHGFFDSLRAELHPHPIHVTLICPGFIHTQVSVNALTGKGQQLGQMDEAQANGMSAAACAAAIASAIRKKKQEVTIGGKERFGVLLKRFFPGLFSKLITRTRVR
ncbi:short-chain dehydrogenase/reductase sdr [Nitritalea halalkaliphila LW7]|uniref:Short-chain dehydrogenase/reductase sdr n=1 Tax=Nitritalea halalkaliphila LW7 TaxID=1189621 RepID=I5C881_9BACT|nr:SDR family oxidoreductase [Nitritalea halalkaliphila]EIM78033.1 short-chain dehydrogenase/reductase sdr [Nitritalea halalkaliphila LW7]